MMVMIKDHYPTSIGRNGLNIFENTTQLVQNIVGHHQTILDHRKTTKHIHEILIKKLDPFKRVFAFLCSRWNVTSSKTNDRH